MKKKKNKARPQKSLKNRIKKIFTYGENEIPDALIEKRNKTFSLAVVTMLLFVIVSIILGSIRGVILGLGVSIALALYGHLEAVSISKKGCSVLTGTCIKVIYQPVDLNKIGVVGLAKKIKSRSNKEDGDNQKAIKSYWIKINEYDGIEVEEEMDVKIPYFEGNAILQKGDVVMIYCTKGCQILKDFDGKYTLGNALLGYE